MSSPFGVMLSPFSMALLRLNFRTPRYWVICLLGLGLLPTQAYAASEEMARLNLGETVGPEVTLPPQSKLPSTISAEPTPRLQPATLKLSAVPSDMATAESVLSELPNADENPLAQVTSVSQLSDVRPTDWAFQALQSLVERYGCIAGYPDKTFRGNRALTRYEFAAGLNACLDRVNELIASATADLTKKDDLLTLQKLQEQFAAELANLRGRVDSLEARTTTLEKQQFSTTTKLSGIAIFGVQGRNSNQADFFPVDGVPDTQDPGTNLNVVSNVQLNLTTQFSPRSLLLIGLQAGSGSTFPSLTNNTRLSYEADTGSSLRLSDVSFRQLIGRNFAVIAGTEGVNAVNVFRGPNRVESSAFGPISAFAQRNPIIGVGAGRAGVGFDWQIASRFSLQGIYSAGNAASPANKAGLFNGANSVGVQLTVAPINTLDLALNYISSYDPDGSLGTGIGDTVLTANGEPTHTNAYGGTVSWRFSPRITLGGWAGWTSSNIPGQSGSVQTFNWMTFLNFPDLFKRGNLGGIYVGQPPRITSSDLALGSNVPDVLTGGLGDSGGQARATTHVEVFYRMRLTDNIAVTPGVLAIFNPGNAGGDTIVVGALRATFAF